VGEHARLFVAAWPPDDVLDIVGALVRPAEPGVRYTPRANWHVTLRFLGTTDVGRAIDTLALVHAAPAMAQLGPVVSRLGRDAVVVAVRGLDRLAGAVRNATVDLGGPPDPHAFRGHLTLARVRDGAASRVVGMAVTASFHVDEIALVRSDLDHGGARYTTVSTHRLVG
jgi:RNA 2',3'-cyclic 3'-phosphodiesterase